MRRLPFFFFFEREEPERARLPACTSASDLSARARSRGGDVAGARWNSLHCRQDQGEERGFCLLPLGGDVETGDIPGSSLKTERLSFQRP